MFSEGQLTCHRRRSSHTRMAFSPRIPIVSTRPSPWLLPNNLSAATSCSPTTLAFATTTYSAFLALPWPTTTTDVPGLPWRARPSPDGLLELSRRSRRCCASSRRLPPRPRSPRPSATAPRAREPSEGLEAQDRVDLKTCNLCMAKGQAKSVAAASAARK